MSEQSIQAQPIHGSIVSAICKIKMTLAAVAKSQKNHHGNYMFASTDDIYAALTKKMGECGLVSIPLELKHEIQRTQRPSKDKQGNIIKLADGSPVMENVNWLHVEVGFALATAEATWIDPTAKRSLFIQYTGPQTHQAAVSFAEKAWLRSLFKLPTGDMDLDAMPQAESEDAQVALSQPQKRKSSNAAKKDGTDKVFNQIVAEVRAAVNADHLRHLRETYAEDWATAPQRWSEILDQEYEDRMETLSVNAE